MATDTTVPLPAFYAPLGRLVRYLSEDFLGGPRLLKMSWVINLQKATTLLFVGGLMVVFDTRSMAAWVYLALHGTYGLCWLLKDMSFPDAGWQRRATLGGALMSWLLVLGPYWVFPVLLISPVLGPGRPEPTGPLVALCIGLHTLGLAIMIAADCQKNVTLSISAGLITTGMFARVRHPNYLGEMMLYAAYALLVQHWIPWAILAWVWTVVFGSNIYRKERSMARYPEWPAYRARTWMLLPRP